VPINSEIYTIQTPDSAVRAEQAGFNQTDRGNWEIGLTGLVEVAIDKTSEKAWGLLPKVGDNLALPLTLTLRGSLSEES